MVGRESMLGTVRAVWTLGITIGGLEIGVRDTEKVEGETSRTLGAL